MLVETNKYVCARRFGQMLTHIIYAAIGGWLIAAINAYRRERKLNFEAAVLFNITISGVGNVNHRSAHIAAIAKRRPAGVSNIEVCCRDWRRSRRNLLEIMPHESNVISFNQLRRRWQPPPKKPIPEALACVAYGVW